MQQNSIELVMKDISKSFGAVQALNNVSLTVSAGRVLALCGENGAGKSTLMKVLAGVHRPDTGQIICNGKIVELKTPGEALELGIAMIYQELDLAPHLTAVENIFLGAELRNSFGMVDYPAMRKITRNLIEENGFNLNPDCPVSELSTGDRQIVELLKALRRQAKVIVMDEPTSSLSIQESERLFEIIKRLRQNRIAVIYISHRLEEIKQLADDISVLRDGQVVFSAPAAEVEIAELVRQMVGRDITDFYPQRQANIGDTVLKVQNLTAENGVAEVSFELHAGEILGMAGLVGSGRTECADALFGIAKVTGGRIELNGQEVNIDSPSQAVESGIAYLTEDRKNTGLFLELPCNWNITMAGLEKLGMKWLLNLTKERQAAEELGQRVKVKWASGDMPGSSLSGGNQQKLLIARWLLIDSQIVIFDEPTRGIDVGAKREVYELINQLADAGKAIILISSDLPEVMGMSDRILVMRDKHQAGICVTAETTPDQVLALAALENNNMGRE